MPDVSFERLRSERDALRNYVLNHADSVLAFEEAGKAWFRRQEGSDEPSSRKIRHITTTASCLESLSDVPLYEGDSPPPPCPAKPEPISENRDRAADRFTRAALAAEGKEWQSEKAASVYCRVRALPVILQLADDQILEDNAESIHSHLKVVLETIQIADIHAQGVAEIPVDVPKKDLRQSYPPNAYHTYWALRFMRAYDAKGDLLWPLTVELKKRAAVAQLWARRTLATHTALISADQPTFDAHQLAWALSTDILCRSSEEDQPTSADQQHTELYDAALAAFFSQQIDGRWPLYDPLFHYPAAGNAYCYTYETLAELLRLALNRSGGRVLRDHLREYADNLIGAWHYARDTELPLANGGKGWCSGHHPHRTLPEAWATASVFSYLQNLRCLIGHWTAEAAQRDLEVRPPSPPTSKAARDRLADRGATWRIADSEIVSRQLAMMFLNPINATRSEPPSIDHDRPLIDEARSALLFGPPGTSKTTLVESIAGALSWNYLEIHASDFLRDGMDNVPAQADAIFMKLMELDHCVVLFDEIDELIRVRSKGSSAPFGRFLTTSMLPKLAKLWDQRRVLFFVATNDIESADPAIKRSQRFDAAVFVPPPSFEKKKAQLEKVLGGGVDLSAEAVEKALAGDAGDDHSLGVFALLRWDQIDDLAHRIEVAERDGKERTEALRTALGHLGEELERTDWQGPEAEETGGGPTGQAATSLGEGNEPHKGIYSRWSQQPQNERRDYRNRAVLGIESELAKSLPHGWQTYGKNGHFVALTGAVEAALTMVGDGSVELTTDDWQAIDTSGLFEFRGQMTQGDGGQR